MPGPLTAAHAWLRYVQVKYWSSGPGAAEGLNPGDVVASNHPQLAGGSHLPDITVTSPVFEGGQLAFFVASRGHHTDIGACMCAWECVHSRVTCVMHRHGCVHGLT